MNMNPCHCIEEIHRYHDGQLPDAQVKQVEAHLAQCPACREELASLASLGALMRDAELPAMRPLDLARVHQRVDQRMNWKAERGVIRLAQWLTAVAAVVLLASSVQLAMIPHQAAQADITPSLAWEMTAAMLQNNAGEGVVTDEHSLAAWIVSDLSISAGPWQGQE